MSQKVIVLEYETKNVIHVYEDLEKVEPISMSEVIWEFGGSGFIEGDFVIVDASFDPKNITDEMILQSKKDGMLAYLDRSFNKKIKENPSIYDDLKIKYNELKQKTSNAKTIEELLILGW